MRFDLSYKIVFVLVYLIIYILNTSGAGVFFAPCTPRLSSAPRALFSRLAPFFSRLAPSFAPYFCVFVRVSHIFCPKNLYIYIVEGDYFWVIVEGRALQVDDIKKKLSNAKLMISEIMERWPADEYEGKRSQLQVIAGMHQ